MATARGRVLEIYRADTGVIFGWPTLRTRRAKLPAAEMRQVQRGRSVHSKIRSSDSARRKAHGRACPG